MKLFKKTARRPRTRGRNQAIKLGVELFEERLLLTNIPVMTTADNGSNMTPFPNSLRAAILAADNTPNSTIVFQIMGGSSPFVIDVMTTALPAITAPTTIDGTTNLGQPAVIQINGGGQAFDGLTLGPGSDGSMITGLDIADFSGAGIRVESTGDAITNNLIGTDPTGKLAGPGNQLGIFVDGASGGKGAIIGGTSASAANTIGFNTGAGVSIAGTAATGNVVEGNFIGTDSAGDDLGNGFGIVVTGGSTTIGGTVAGAVAANVIGMNSASGAAGVSISGGANVVEGNFIGTSAGGASLPNTVGIAIGGGTNTIGGTIAGAAAANVIGHNSSAGVSLSGGSNVALGNFIGTNANGIALGNGNGIVISAGTNTIGGTVAGGAAANVIGLSNTAGAAGVSISGGTNVVEGDFIGTSASGANLHNTVGIEIGGGTSTIGGTVTGAANVVGFNSSAGVSISGASNLVAGNFIGTNANSANLGNGTGLIITGTGNLIGGSIAGAANTIAFNAGDGVQVSGTTATGNLISQNSIFSNGGLGIDLLNGGNHELAVPTIIAVASVPDLTTIDFEVTGTVTQAYTVEFFASSTTGAAPAFQFLGATTVTLTASTQKFTEPISSLSSALQSSQTVTATVTASNHDTSEFAASVSLSPALVVTNTSDNVQGEAVGSLRQAILDANNSPLGPNSITFELPKSDPGFKPATSTWSITLASTLPAIMTTIFVDGTSQPGYIGAPVIQINGHTNNVAGDGLQLASGSDGSRIRGLDIEGFASGAGIDVVSNDDVIQSNYLGTDVTGTTAGPGNLDGLLIDGTSSNTVGGSATIGNLISGNTAVGVLIQGDTATANVLLGNKIGTDSTGTADLPNSGDGVRITRTTLGASNNTIGGTAAAAGNTIAYNTGNAVTVNQSTGNAIRQNSIFANGAGIALTSGGNAGQLPPTLTFVNSAGGSTQIQGSVSGFAANSTFTIEFFASAAGDPSVPGQAHVFLGNTSITTDGTGAAPIDVTLAVSVPASQTVTATATSPANNTSPFATSVMVVDPFLVTNVLDSGSGSLRQAITNANSTPGLNTITFAIPGIGPFVITLASILPTIKDPIVLDGTTQPGYSGSPFIQINGHGLPVAGLILGSGSDGSTIKGLDIVDFAGAGIDVGSGGNTVQSNDVGVGFSGTAAGPGNQIGILIDGSGNLIGGTGAGNVIAFNIGDGVDVDSGTGDAIRQNLIFGNTGQAIFLNTSASANNNQPAPTLTAVTSSSGKTFITGNVAAFTGQLTVEFFANSTSTPPSATSPAFNFLGSAPLSASGTFSVTLPVSVGVGLLVSAAATVTTPLTPNDTSIFSTSFAVTNPFVVTTLLDNGMNSSPLPGSLRQVIESVNGNPAGPNTISFGVTGTIVVPAATPLPTLMVPATINGTTNPIVLSGAGQVADGLTLGNGSQGSIIEGLTLTGFTSDAILIQSSNNTIGGTATGAGNVITGNTGDAVHVAAGTDNAIRQNLITFTSPGQGIVVDTAVEGTPAVTAVSSVRNLTTIDGSVIGMAAGTYTVEFFASSSSGPSPAGQFLGSTTVTFASTLTFPAKLPFTAMLNLATPLVNTQPATPPPFIQSVTATVTDPDNSTSEFATTTAHPVSNPFLVSNTSDNTPGSWVGSLRLAILNANSQPAAAGSDAITFQTGGNPFVITVATGLPLPTINVPVSIQGITSPATAVEVEINGGGQSFDGVILGPGSGGANPGTGSTIAGLDIANFQGAAIHIESSNNVVSGNFLGTDLTGTAAGPGNLVGVLVDNASGNLIGATNPSLANTIGFNTQNGISVLTGTGNAIRGNRYLGTNGPATPTEASDIAVAQNANGGQAAPILTSAVYLGNEDLQILFNASVPTGTTMVTIDAYLVNSMPQSAEPSWARLT